MCGILGFVAGEKTGFSPDVLKSATERLFTLSESRGKEAAGLAISNHEKIEILKSAISASQMLRTDNYKKLLKSHLSNGHSPNGSNGGYPVTVIGHSRLVTTGTQYDGMDMNMAKVLSIIHSTPKLKVLKN